MTDILTFTALPDTHTSFSATRRFAKLVGRKAKNLVLEKRGKAHIVLLNHGFPKPRAKARLLTEASVNLDIDLSLS